MSNANEGVKYEKCQIRTMKVSNTKSNKAKVSHTNEGVKYKEGIYEDDIK